MSDVHSPATRSKNMRAIRSCNTRPERLIRCSLHAAGIRYRLHRADLPGKPDLVLPKFRTVIFIHGCFWHGHSCKYFRLPQTNSEFWREKISGNCKRDQRNTEQLTALGWRVLIVWECSLRSSGPGLAEVSRRILASLEEQLVCPVAGVADFSP
ncbi:DNA mismatch endonuclease Vsr [Iodobacter sp. HSC-16F04]|uniref:DNA mismatch endonuclease Vsr n=1 Tax=Iodobacter violaceini TaxID=3044271 RepID=A0ABX0KX14_9NEIS|nr:DNA mismatch endonuclease Vsr [Iodobacter violacea]NHQ86659.1 DNA mismatch endonuclease Vsr [Iodobacter violacea]